MQFASVPEYAPPPLPKAAQSSITQLVISAVVDSHQTPAPSSSRAELSSSVRPFVNVKPDSKKELQAFSLSGPSDVVSVASLANNGSNAFQEKVIINRVEYADGTIWQRKDWNFEEAKFAVTNGDNRSRMCRSF